MKQVSMKNTTLASSSVSPKTAGSTDLISILYYISWLTVHTSFLQISNLRIEGIKESVSILFDHT